MESCWLDLLDSSCLPPISPFLLSLLEFRFPLDYCWPMSISWGSLLPILTPWNGSLGQSFSNCLSLCIFKISQQSHCYVVLLHVRVIPHMGGQHTDFPLSHSLRWVRWSQAWMRLLGQAQPLSVPPLHLCTRLVPQQWQMTRGQALILRPHPERQCPELSVEWNDKFRDTALILVILLLKNSLGLFIAFVVKSTLWRVVLTLLQPRLPPVLLGSTELGFLERVVFHFFCPSGWVYSFCTQPWCPCLRGIPLFSL